MDTEIQPRMDANGREDKPRTDTRSLKPRRTTRRIGTPSPGSKRTNQVMIKAMEDWPRLDQMDILIRVYSRPFAVAKIIFASFRG
jgi:hypothetical protein